jgi:membrane protein involved in colicin uptake
MVVVLSVILFVLLVWKAIDEMVDGRGSNGDSSSNRFPPY